MLEWILSSSALILTVFILRLVLTGHISLRLRYGLWLLVLVRLLLPVQLFQSAISVQNLAVDQPAVHMAQEITNLNLPKQTYQEARQELVQAYQTQGMDAEAIAQEDPEAFSHLVMEQMESEVSVGDILTGIWLTGGGVVLLWILLSNVRFLRALRKERTRVEAEQTGLPVWVSPAARTPCLVGIFRPCIYLTPEAAADPEAMEHVLAHELAHYRHGDNLFSLLRCVALALHWYNPLVWMAATASRQDAEMACDEAAIARLGEDSRLSYGQTLIRMTCCARSHSSILLTSTTLTHTRGSLKQRISAIARRPRTAIVTFALVLAVAVVAVGCTFTGARDPSQPEVTQPTTESTQPTEPAVPEEPTAPDGAKLLPIGNDAVEGAALSRAQTYFDQRLLELKKDGYTQVSTTVLGQYPLNENSTSGFSSANKKFIWLVAVEGRFTAASEEKTERGYVALVSDYKDVVEELGWLTQENIDSYQGSAWGDPYWGATAEAWNAHIRPPKNTDPAQLKNPSPEYTAYLKAQDYFAALLSQPEYSGYTAATVGVPERVALSVATRPAGTDLRLFAVKAKLEGADPTEVTAYILLRNGGLQEFEGGDGVIYIDTFTQEQLDAYDTPEMARDYGNAATAMSIIAWKALEEPSAVEAKTVQNVLSKALEDNLMPIRISEFSTTHYFGGSFDANQLNRTIGQYFWFRQPEQELLKTDAPYVELGLGGQNRIRFYALDGDLVELYLDGIVYRWRVEEKDNGSSLYSQMWRRYDLETMSLVGYRSDQETLEAAVKDFAENLIPSRHLNAYPGSWYYAEEVKVQEYKIIKTYDEGEKAYCTVTYLLRQTEPSIDGYAGHTYLIESGEYKDWLRFECEFTIEKEDGYWEYDQD